MAAAGAPNGERGDRLTSCGLSLALAAVAVPVLLGFGYIARTFAQPLGPLTPRRGEPVCARGELRLVDPAPNDLNAARQRLPALVRRLGLAPVGPSETPERFLPTLLDPASHAVAAGFRHDADCRLLAATSRGATSAFLYLYYQGGRPQGVYLRVVQGPPGHRRTVDEVVTSDEAPVSGSLALNADATRVTVYLDAHTGSGATFGHGLGGAYAAAAPTWRSAPFWTVDPQRVNTRLAGKTATGSRLYVVDEGRDLMATRLWVINCAAASVREVKLHGAALPSYLDLLPSPDGRQLATCVTPAGRGGTRRPLFLVDSTSGQVTAATARRHGDYADGAVGWSASAPDRLYLVDALWNLWELQPRPDQMTKVAP